jgi:hypothetical protein
VSELLSAASLALVMTQNNQEHRRPSVLWELLQSLLEGAVEVLSASLKVVGELFLEILSGL